MILKNEAVWKDPVFQSKPAYRAKPYKQTHEQRNAWIHEIRVCVYIYIYICTIYDISCYDASSCLYVCVYVCLYVCMYVCVYLQMYVCAHLFIEIHMHTYLHIYTCTHIYIFIYTHTYAFIYIYIYICIYTSTHMFLSVHTKTRKCDVFTCIMFIFIFSVLTFMHRSVHISDYSYYGCIVVWSCLHICFGDCIRACL